VVYKSFAELAVGKQEPRLTAKRQLRSHHVIGKVPELPCSTATSAECVRSPRRPLTCFSNRPNSSDR
jgi:hypothetical protein